MSNFGYNQLQEEPGSPGAAPFEDPKTSETNKVLSSKTPYDSLQLNSDEEFGSTDLRSAANHDNRPSSENVRYTALRPISVRELIDNEVEHQCSDQEGTDSSVLVTLSSGSKRISISKIYVIICGLLIACVVLVGFGLIYVFIILPTYNEKTSHSDPAKDSVNLEQSVDNILVKTSCGRVRGTKEQDVYVFRGIPYAVPPTGGRRWKPPVARDSDPSICKDDVLNATKYGSKCVQPMFGNSSVTEGSEDCLYVNIWTPSLNSNKLLPVMVWFHSGDFVYGSGHVQGMSPTPQVALATNSVFVSFNYRLGVFGFLAMERLREEPGGATGNYGFMDQQLLLKWVKKNIRQFGGNETLVTIFGHGSGATSVQAMLLSPGSRGLFHKAWLTSPVAVLNKTVDEACRDNESFLKKSGCGNVQCLRQMAADKVSRLSPWPLQPHWGLHQLFRIPNSSQLRNGLPIFDGHVVPWSSQKSGPTGPVVPFVFGSTYFDLSSLETEQAVVNMTWDEYNELLDQHVGVLGPDAVTRVKSLYSDKHRIEYTSSANFPSAPGVQFSHIVGDIKNVCPVKILADSFVNLFSNSTAVYMYVAEIYPSYNFRLGSSEKTTFLGWDIVAFFDTFKELDFIVGQGELNFQNILREEIMSFIKAGQPDASRWKTADVNTGVIGRDVTVIPVTSEYFGQCDFWKQHQFFNYTWTKVT